jgi:hypothetical protein
MCFEVGRVDLDRRVVGGLCRQPRPDPGEHSDITLPFPAIVESLVGPYSRGASRERKPL